MFIKSPMEIPEVMCVKRCVFLKKVTKPDDHRETAGLVFVGVRQWLYLPPLCPSGIWKRVTHSAKYKRCNVSFTSNGKYFSHSSKISGSRLVFLRHLVQALECVNNFWQHRSAVGVEVSVTNFRPLMSGLPNDCSYSAYTALYYR